MTATLLTALILTTAIDPPGADEHYWSVGAGLVSSEVVEPIQGEGLTPPLPRLSLMLERLIGDNLAIGLQASGGHTLLRVSRGPVGSRERIDKSTLTGGDIALSLRWRGDDTSVVEVSPFIAVGYGWARVGQETIAAEGSDASDSNSDTDISLIRGGAGFSVETKLVAELRIRFTTLILSGRYITPEPSGGGEDSESRVDVEEGSIGLDLRPGIELRMRF